MPYGMFEESSHDSCFVKKARAKGQCHGFLSWLFETSWCLSTTLFEVMSSQATDALLNNGVSTTTGSGYGSAVERQSGVQVPAPSGDSRDVLQDVGEDAPAQVPVDGGADVPRPSNQPDEPAVAEDGATSVRQGQSGLDDRDLGSQAVPQIGAQRTAENSGPASADLAPGLATTDGSSGMYDETRGFQTPRSRASQFTAGNNATGASWPGWMTRLGGLFNPTVPTAWLPSPIPSPPRPPTQLLRRTLDLGGAENVEGGLGGFRLRSRNPNAQTPTSSSIPAEAIQAEVQRQLGSLLDRLSVAEAENARLQEALHSQQQRPSIQQDAASGSARASGLPLREEGLGTRGRDQRGVIPLSSGDPWSSIWEGISGKFGARAKVGAQQTEPRMPSAAVPELLGAPAVPLAKAESSEPLPTGSPPNILEALAQGMQQLQDLQAKALKKDGSSDDTPEVVKTATVSLPILPSPHPENSGVQLQDWMVQVTTSMQDLSAGSGDWWENVRELASDTYATWFAATPLESLQVVPHDHHKLVTGRWTRVNAHACALMMQAFSEVTKADLIARRATQSAVLMLFRILTIYQPGGAAERGIVLQHLQGTEVPVDVTACLTKLRSWPRWLQRCRDMNMTTPDGTLLARSLTATASKFLAENPDAVFRTQLVRSSYRIDAQPTVDDVLKYHQHLQAEIENIVISKTTASTGVPAIKAITSTGSSGDVASTGNAKTCKYFLKPSGCRRGPKCPFLHSFEGMAKADKARKCLSCGSEDHRQKECPAKVPRAPQTSRGAGEGTPTSTSASPKAATINKAQVEPEGESSPAKASDPTVAQGQPILSWEALLQAAAKVAGASPATEPKAPSMKVMAVYGGSNVGGQIESAYALVDSGATHPSFEESYKPGGVAGCKSSVSALGRRRSCELEDECCRYLTRTHLWGHKKYIVLANCSVGGISWSPWL